MSKYKQILKTAATETRENLFKQSNLSNQSVDCILTSCSRAVFTQDVSFAKFLQQKHSLARKHLRVDATARSENPPVLEGFGSQKPPVLGGFGFHYSVQVVSAPQFSLELSQARHSHLSEHIQRCESRGKMQNLNSSTRQRCLSKSLHLTSLIRQWIPISKFVTISAITIRNDSNEDGQELITDTEAVLLQLARY